MSMMKNLLLDMAENLVRETGCSLDDAMELLMKTGDYDTCIELLRNKKG